MAEPLDYLDIEPIPESKLDEFDWGMTEFDKPLLTVGAVCVAPGAWRGQVVKATHQTHQIARLLPKVTEPTGGVVARTVDCGVLRKMAYDLVTESAAAASGGVGRGTRYYMLGAVQKHEDEHVRQYKENVAGPVRDFKRKVAAITVPAPSQAAAVTAIKKSAPYQQALSAYESAELTANNEAADHKEESYQKVEEAVVDPMLHTITFRRAAMASITGRPC